MTRRVEADEVRKIVAFDRETWTALHLLALDTMASFQELADEAFATCWPNIIGRVVSGRP